MAMKMSVGGDMEGAGPAHLGGKPRFYRAAQDLLTVRGIKRLVPAGSSALVFAATGLLPGEFRR